MAEQQLPPAIQMQLQTEIREYMTENDFPNHLIPERFNYFKSIVMRDESPVTMQCNIATFARMFSSDKDYLMIDLYQILEKMGIKTMNQLKLSIEDYEAFHLMVEETVGKWNAIIQPVQETIKRKLLTRARITAHSPKKGI